MGNKTPEQGFLDHLTRIDELLIENTNAIKKLALAATRPDIAFRLLISRDDIDIGKSLSELRQELENGSIRNYEIKEYSLASARTGTANDIEIVEGTAIHAWTDGSLEGVGVKFNSIEADTVYFNRWNPIATPFFGLVLVNGAQTGKTLYLLISKSNAMDAEAGEKPVMPVPRFHTIRTDKDTHFSGAIAQNAKEDENLTGLLNNKCRITGVSLQSDQALDYRVIFWKTDGFDDTDLDDDTFCGEVEVDLPFYGYQIGGANQYYLDVRGLEIDYEDEDASNELHVSLMNLSATGKEAGAIGEVVVEIYYEPRS